MLSALGRAWQATKIDRERWALRWRKGPGLSPLLTAAGAALIAYGVWTIAPAAGYIVAGLGVWLMEWRLNG